jgi:hypothetical protein
MSVGFEPSTACVPRAGEPGGVCSGRGQCFQFTNGTSVNGVTAFCICEPGWSPIGDLTTDPSIDCGINIVAQRVLWGIAAVPHLLLVLVCATRLYLNRASLTTSNVQARAFALVVIYGGLFFIVSVMQAANTVPGARSIGIDPVTTTLFVIGSTACFIGVSWSAALYCTAID